MLKPAINKKVLAKRAQRKYHIPVIGHFGNRSIRFNSIIEAEKYTGISYHLLFEAAVGKIKGASRPKTPFISYWEFEDGKDWIKYKSYYLRHQYKYTRMTGFNG